MAMTTTKTKKATPIPVPPGTAPDKVTLKPHEVLLSPTVQGGVGIHTWGKYAGEADLSELVADLRKRVERVQGGDMRPVEAMLMSQAAALETIFTNLATRAYRQEYMSQLQTYLTLALKAQAQCRATLEALAEVKNPRQVAFVKQANIAQQQQVNNGVSNQVSSKTRPVLAREHAHAERNPSQQNGLLEVNEIAAP